MSEVFRFIGFCGADDSVSPQLLRILSQHYNWIEWGVLFRTDLEGTARYASPQWVQELGRVQAEAGGSMHLAAHLCANRCQEILFGDFAFVKSMAALGFRRAQVNATAANQVTVDPNRIAEYVSNIQLCIRSVPEIEWIIQCNTETTAIWTELVKDPQPNMSLLHDASCGKGVLVTSFPSPSLYPTIRCGYAGGIGPATISAILENVAVVVGETSDKRPVWVDMESSLRTIIITNNATGEKKDTFSIDKCFNVVEKAVAFGLKPSM